MDDRTFTDEELSAFLDGEAAFAPMAEIARALEHDAELRARVEGLRRASDLVIAAFQAVGPDLASLPDFAKRL